MYLLRSEERRFCLTLTQYRIRLLRMYTFVFFSNSALLLTIYFITVFKFCSKSLSNSEALALLPLLESPDSPHNVDHEDP